MNQQNKSVLQHALANIPADIQGLSNKPYSALPTYLSYRLEMPVHRQALNVSCYYNIGLQYGG
jgi:hypothetical protein